MIRVPFEKTKVRIIGQLVLILSWLTSLKESDSYFYVYALMALAGSLCLWDNHQNPEKIPVSQKIWMSLLAAVFSGTVVLANYFLFEPLALLTLFNLGCTVVGGWLLGYHILQCIGRRLPISQAAPDLGQQKPGKIFLLCFASVAVIDLMYLFTVAYPGILTSDSMSQMMQIHTGEFDNWHPYWHSWVIGIFVNLGKSTVYHLGQ